MYNSQKRDKRDVRIPAYLAGTGLCLLFAIYVLLFHGNRAHAVERQTAGEYRKICDTMRTEIRDELTVDSGLILARMRGTDFSKIKRLPDKYSIFAAYSGYSHISHIGSEPSGYININTMYANYINYMLSIAGSGKVLPFSLYSEYIGYWETLIPGQFVYTMFNESLKQQVPMEYIYGIAYVESLNFRFFRSLKANHDGSIDVGIMGLNDKNYDLSTKNGRSFIESNFRFDSEFDGVEFNEHNQLHIVKVCVRYYKSLISFAGGSKWSALVCYNGGPNNWKRGKSSKAANAYAERVYNIARNNAVHSEPWNAGIDVSDVLSAFVLVAG